VLAVPVLLVKIVVERVFNILIVGQFLVTIEISHREEGQEFRGIGLLSDDVFDLLLGNETIAIRVSADELVLDDLKALIERMLLMLFYDFEKKTQKMMPKRGKRSKFDEI
jgi:hypothetical protein